MDELKKKEMLTNIHFEIIRNSILTSREIADGVGDFIQRYTTGSEFAEVSVALMNEDKDEVFALMKKILNEAIWYMAEEQTEEENQEPKKEYDD